MQIGFPYVRTNEEACMLRHYSSGWYHNMRASRDDVVRASIISNIMSRSARGTLYRNYKECGTLMLVIT